MEKLKREQLSAIRVAKLLLDPLQQNYFIGKQSALMDP